MLPVLLVESSRVDALSLFVLAGLLAVVCDLSCRVACGVSTVVWAESWILCPPHRACLTAWMFLGDHALRLALCTYGSSYPQTG